MSQRTISLQDVALMDANGLNYSRLDYFEPLLKPRHSVYNTYRSQADGMLLEVPPFASSVCKSTNISASALHMMLQRFVMVLLAPATSLII